LIIKIDQHFSNRVKGLIPYKSIVKEKQQRQVLMLPPPLHLGTCSSGSTCSARCGANMLQPWGMEISPTNMADECDIM